jgi:hypothetical protein
MENLFICNICNESIRKDELEEHILSQNHQNKKRVLVDTISCNENKDTCKYVKSVIDKWKEYEK